MPLTEKEKFLISASLRYEDDDAMFEAIEEAVARCEQDAKAEGRKEAELEFSEGQIKELIERQRKEAKAEERKRIVEWIKIKSMKDGFGRWLSLDQLAELEKGD